MSSVSSSGRVNAWSISTPEIRLIATKYNIPIQLLLSLNADNVDTLRRIAEAYKLATDANYAQFKLVMSDEALLFGRPEALKVRELQQGLLSITIRFKTVPVVWTVHREKLARLGNSVEEIVDRLSGYLLVKAEKKQTKRGTVWAVKKIKIMHVDEDRETFRRLVSIYARRYDYPVLAALAAVYGYVPDITETEALTLLVPRFAVIMAGDVTQPTLHGFELTVPGTGKTTMASITEIALNWMYFSEPPSPATLLGDARVGWSPLTSSNGVWFDEVDAWMSMRQREDFREAVSAILTGMEQCKWERGKGGIKRPHADKCLPLYFTGNVNSDGMLVLNYRGKEVPVGIERARDAPRVIVGSILPAKRDAFTERLATVVIIKDSRIPQIIQDYTMTRRSGRIVQGRPSVIRGAKALIAEWVAEHWDAIPVERGVFENRRLQQRYEALVKVLAVLLGQPGEPLTDKRVYEIARRYVEGVIL